MMTYFFGGLIIGCVGGITLTLVFVYLAVRFHDNGEHIDIDD